MPDSKSCEHLERLAGAAARRREAEDARQRAVEELHREVASAIAAPGCSHSQRAIAKAAGLSLGGVHNALLTVASSEAVMASPVTGAPSPTPKAQLEAPAEPRSCEGEPPVAGAPSPTPKAQLEAPGEPQRSEGEPPVTGAPSPTPKSREEAPAAPRSATKLPSGTAVRKVERYAASGRARRDASARPRAKQASASPKVSAGELKHAEANGTRREAGGQPLRGLSNTGSPAPAAKRIEDHLGRPRQTRESAYPDPYASTVAAPPSAKRRRQASVKRQASEELYPGIY
jgi:hypothetical protein